MGAEGGAAATAVAKPPDTGNAAGNANSNAGAAGVAGRPRGRAKAPRPRKKARVPSTPPRAESPPPAAAAAPSTAQAPAPTGGGSSRGMPESMDEYRDGCLRLEKARHERVYQSEKRRYYAERAIEQSYEWEVRAAEEAYTAGVRAAVERLLERNLKRQQLLEERRFGIAHRPNDNATSGAYGNGGRPHGMSLRTRNGGGSGDEKKGGGNGADEEAPTHDGGRASRRNRKETRNGNGNGGNGGNNHAQPRVKLVMALDEEDVNSDLLKITRGGKRARESENGATANERRNKKRK